MLLFCKYGFDPSNSARGLVMASHDDDQDIPADAYPSDWIAVSYDKPIVTLPRVGPAPADDEPDARPREAPLLTLNIARVSKERSLSLACRALLLGGFTSSALGSKHTYPSSDRDQNNLNAKAAAAAGVTGDGWSAALKCQDEAGDWVRLPHTADQLRRVSSDFLAFHDETLAKLDRLTNAAESAKEVDAIGSISW